MPIRVELSFETILRVIDALRHGSIAESAHQSNRAIGDLFVELLHPTIELQCSVFEMAGTPVYVGRTMHIHASDGDRFLLQSKLENASQRVPAEIGEGDLLTLNRRHGAESTAQRFGKSSSTLRSAGRKVSSLCDPVVGDEQGIYLAIRYDNTIG